MLLFSGRESCSLPLSVLHTCTLWELYITSPGIEREPESSVYLARVYSVKWNRSFYLEKDVCEEFSLATCLWTCSFLRWCALLVENRVLSGLLQNSAKITPEIKSWHRTLIEYANILSIHQYIGKSNSLEIAEDSAIYDHILNVSAYDKKRCHALVHIRIASAKMFGT